MEVLEKFLSPYLIALLVSTGIGFIVGLEREFRVVSEKNHYAGLRTFPLVAILGCLVAFAGRDLSPWLPVTSLVAFIILIGVAYYVRFNETYSGITTEISLIITYVLGMMTSFDMIKESLAAAVITTTILSLKESFRTFVSHITQDELFAFIKFIILAVLLLPFLPDVDYGPSGIFNPREIGAVIVIVSSISFASYVLIKLRGPGQGILLSAFFGGLFSSTAVTWMFSGRSRAGGSVPTTLYSAGIVIACSIMFLRVAMLSAIFNIEVFKALVWPCAIMCAIGLAFAWFQSRTIKSHPADAPMELGNPVDMLNALGFGCVYVAIILMVHYAGEYAGNNGLLVSGFLSGFADVDAITIAMSKLDVTGGTDLPVLVIVIAMVSNTIVKIGIAMIKGAPELRPRVGLALTAIIAAGILYMWAI
ncbi:MAG TPA: MgtC/SapB family protein [Cyclobacteriaceae bacterium]|nr:MgtC/SapB family protein [Cyclobacteriaceae bacterium]